MRSGKKTGRRKRSLPQKPQNKKGLPHESPDSGKCRGIGSTLRSKEKGAVPRIPEKFGKTLGTGNQIIAHSAVQPVQHHTDKNAFIEPDQQIVVIDSIQTISTEDVETSPGSPRR